MKSFLKKIFTLSSVILLLPFFLMVSLEFQFKNIDTSEIYPKYLKLTKEKKEFPLDILIAGDSRAERQIIPEGLKGNNQEKILNLAIGSGDINRLRDFITNRRETDSLINKKTILVISASPQQTNDNRQRWGRLSNSTFKYLSFYEKLDILKLKKDYFKYLLSIHKYYLKNIFNHRHYNQKIDNLGYLGVDGDVTVINSAELGNIIHRMIKDYGSIKGDGYRIREFKKSIKFFSAKFDKVIIIFPPVTNIWRASILNTNIEDFNQNIIFKTNEFVKTENLSNTLVWDFYNKNDFQVNDSDYYDTHHLNNLGAIKFTKKLREKLDNLSDSIYKP